MECRASDGCVLASNYELIVHDALLQFLGRHPVVHPPIPNFRGQADFRDNDVYIEVWGRNDPDYGTDRTEKVEHYHAMGLPLVEFDFTSGSMTVPRLQKTIRQVLEKSRATQKPISPDAPVKRPTQLLLWARSLAQQLAEADGRPVKELQASIAAIEEKIALHRRQIDEIHRREAEEVAVMGRLESEALARTLSGTGVREKITFDKVAESRQALEPVPEYVRATGTVLKLRSEAEHLENVIFKLSDEARLMQRRLDGIVEEYLGRGASSAQ